MSSKQAPVVVAASTKLAPTIVTKSKAVEVAVQDGRKRPILAINEDGKLVVCCRRTAKKNGWEVQEALYGRTKPAPVPAPEPVVEAPKAKKPAKAKKPTKTTTSSVEDLLG